MALTIRKLGKVQSGGPADVGGSRVQMLFGEIDFDNSYPTNGEEMDISAEIKNPVAVLFEQGALTLRYDYTNKKVIAYWTPAGHSAVFAEVTNTTDLSAQTAIKFVALGY